ncbi:hypothetical protein BDA96_03G129400 [Sorghum bicolor]|uniref:Uncharacterized protein n=2 Tax=Sorghum bicolor TaxID=4558 RepID=A0A921RDK6_SORBI|nr:uncharacterized protein LOC8054627 [Sorghum bicolor]KAG0537216.1 hypothetical protein BDA96_03G129400 [Sorghum bicolor]KXG32227.1 hypothetical protein SORBI_3003G123900 [Sorghum bicolor]|eukprot:XP_021313381.1 uncharacterized protein LOC8054627 [Sorghum bicolor]
MASIVLLLSELLGGESASVLAAERYMSGHRCLAGEFRPAVTEAPGTRQGQRLVVVADQHAAAAGTERARVREEDKEESFEDLAASRFAVDVMWP